MERKEKHHVFSARTTGEGLRRLNEVKARLGIGWGDLVIEGISAYYGLDRAEMTLPRKEKPSKEAPTAEQQAPAETTGEARPVEEKTKKKSE
jgi:hypothetical protein